MGPVADRDRHTDAGYHNTFRVVYDSREMSLKPGLVASYDHVGLKTEQAVFYSSRGTHTHTQGAFYSYDDNFSLVGHCIAVYVCATSRDGWV